MNVYKNDIEWANGRLKAKLSAVDETTAAMTVIRPYTQNETHGVFIAYFERVDAKWDLKTERDGSPSVFDATRSGDFLQMDSINSEIQTFLQDAVERLTENDRDFVTLGRSRDAESIRLAIEHGRLKADEARTSVRQYRDVLDREGKDLFGPDFDIREITPDGTPYSFSTLVDSEFGPLILTIVDAMKFSYKSPGGIPTFTSDGNQKPISCSFDGAKGWKGLPDSRRMSDKIVSMGMDVSGEFTEIVREAGYRRFANELFRMNLVNDGINRYVDQMNDRDKTEAALREISELPPVTAPKI